MRAAGGEEVEDGVEDVAWGVFGLSVVVDALWQAWLDELPLVVGEVGRIGFSCRVHRGIIPHFSLPVHALSEWRRGLCLLIQAGKSGACG